MTSRWRLATTPQPRQLLSKLAWAGFALTFVFLAYSLWLLYLSVGVQASDVQLTGSLAQEWQRAAVSSFLNLRDSLNNIAAALLGAVWASVLLIPERRVPAVTVPFWGSLSCATLGLVGSMYAYYRFSTHFLDAVFQGAFSPNTPVATIAWETQSFFLVAGAIGVLVVLAVSIGERA